MPSAQTSFEELDARSASECGADTSFMIAIKKLRAVREGLAKVGRTPKIRCMFVEKEPGPYRALEAAVRDVTDIQIEALNGEFEYSIPEVLKFVGSAFSLVFIDPTGWTGFGLKQITPILQHRPGEVLVNFMFDYIHRFLVGDRLHLAGGNTRKTDALALLKAERLTLKQNWRLTHEHPTRTIGAFAPFAQPGVI